MTLHYIPFDDTYRAAYRQVSRVVRHGNLLFTCGQLDADGHGVAQNLGDLRRQTERCVALINDAVEQAGGEAADVLKLQVFFRASERMPTTDYQCWVDSLVEQTTKPMINYTPIATFPKGVEVEMDATALIGAHDLSTRHARRGACSVLRCDSLLFASATVDGGRSQPVQSIIDELAACLETLGCDLTDLCRLRFYQQNLPETPSNFEVSLGNTLASSPLVYTRLPLHSSGATEAEIRLEFDGVKHTVGSQTVVTPVDTPWPDPWSLGYAQALRRGDLLFIGGQLPANVVTADSNVNANIKDEIRFVMENIQTLLARFDADYRNVAKVNAYYAGHDSLETWTSNVQSRCDFYPQPGPASTGVEVTTVGLKDKRVCVDCTAILDLLD